MTTIVADQSETDAPAPILARGRNQNPQKTGRTHELSYPTRALSTSVGKPVSTGPANFLTGGVLP